MLMIREQKGVRFDYGATLPDGMKEHYPVLSELERARAWRAPLRTEYVHLTCGVTTEIQNRAIAETIARRPDYYSQSYCAGCKEHFPVYEFVWLHTNEVLGGPDESI